MIQSPVSAAIAGPPRFEATGARTIIEDLILYGRHHKAADLNIGISKITMEVYGRIWDIPTTDEVTKNDIREFCDRWLIESERERLVGPVGVADGAMRDPDNGNVRIHAYRRKSSVALALRLLNKGIPNFDELNLPQVVKTFSQFESGIVLFTGKTGSGKTTGLASLIDIINRTQNHHIYTLEDPIEYEHPELPNSLISQTEIGRDVISYAEGLRGVLRAAPHVMMFAEMRDAESVNAALMASSSGHLVFSTLHTSEATETVQRIVNYFPPEQFNNVRTQFAQALRAAVSMRLIPRADGKGRVPACEILVNTSAVRAMLEDPDKVKQLRNEIKLGSRHGMQLLESDLGRLVHDGVITMAAARMATNYPDAIEGGSNGRL